MSTYSVVTTSAASSLASTQFLTTRPPSSAIPAGDSGTAPISSSSLIYSLSPVSGESATPKYKTVYVTRTAEPNHNAGSPDLSSGAIAGMVVGALAFLALVCGLVYFLLRRRRQKKGTEAIELPSSSGSQSSTVVAEKSAGDVHEAYGTRDQNVYEMSGQVVYEMEASMPELEGSKSAERDSALKPRNAAMIASRNIMSRGRPVKREFE